MTLSARPHRLTIACWVCAACIVAIFAGASLTLHGTTGGGGHFERGDQFALIGVGVLIALGVLAISRPRVWADERGVRGRNLFGSYDLPWQVVTAVRFDDDSPWAALDLIHDERVAVMAIQALDKEYALRAVTELRRLHAEHASAAEAE